jgi:hypothetical protein
MFGRSAGGTRRSTLSLLACFSRAAGPGEGILLRARAAGGTPHTHWKHSHPQGPAAHRPVRTACLCSTTCRRRSASVSLPICEGTRRSTIDRCSDGGHRVRRRRSGGSGVRAAGAAGAASGAAGIAAGIRCLTAMKAACPESCARPLRGPSTRAPTLRSGRGRGSSSSIHVHEAFQGPRGAGKGRAGGRRTWG